MFALADRFVAAIERGDIEAIRAIYAPEARIWHNTDPPGGDGQSVDDNLKVLRWMQRVLSDKRYEIVARHETPTGFVQQHILRGTIVPTGAPSPCRPASSARSRMAASRAWTSISTAPASRRSPPPQRRCGGRHERRNASMIVRLHRPMRLVVAALLAFGLAASPAVAQTPPDDPASMYVNQRYDRTRSAADDLRQAMDWAQASNRNILLEVGGEWCSWCHLLDRSIDANPLVKSELARSFVVVKVNYEPAFPNTRFLGAYPRVSGYPAFIVLGPDGKFLALQDTGLLESGHNYDKGKLTLFALRWRRP